jgi:hypothetical protein
MAATYDVKTITATTRYNTDGAIGNAYTITFTTKPSGLTSSITVDGERFNPADVDPMIALEVQRLEAIKAL